MLTVIVPVYNVERFLPRCLESICNQTYRNLEIICVDDGSVDNSGAILDEYAARDPRIKVIHQKNAGVSAARNAGLDAAAGEFVTFVDSDDWLEPDAYEMVLAVLSAEVDMVCSCGVVDGDVSDEVKAEMQEYCRLKYSGKQSASAGILATDVYVWNKVFRKSLLEKYSIRFPVGIACGEDAAFYFSYAAVARDAYYLPEKLYHYVQHPASAMAQFRKKSARGLDHLKVVEYVYDFYVTHGVKKKMQSVFDLLFVLYYRFTLDSTPESMRQDVMQFACKIARRSGAIRYRRSCEIRDLVRFGIGYWENMFHWINGNRECYGMKGRAVCSCTYEDSRTVFRIIGCKVYTKNYKEK